MSDTAIWNTQNLTKSGKRRHFPSESVLRAALSTRYFHLSRPLKTGARVLDIGCLYANNLVPFADRGHELYGVEVNPEAVEMSRLHLLKNNISAQVKVGTNRQLPFPDAFFDLVMSISTIHYEEAREDIRLALAEFKRVLAPSGRLVVRTVGPLDDLDVIFL